MFRATLTRPIAAAFSILVLCMANLTAQTPEPDARNGTPAGGRGGNPDSPTSVTQRGDKIELTVQSPDGIVRWKDVAKALSHTLTLDLSVAEGALPSGSWDLNAPTVALTARAVTLATQGRLRIDLIGRPGNVQACTIRCDRSILGPAAARRYRAATLDLDTDWKRRTSDRPLVVCLHGMNGQPDTFDGLRECLRQSGFATAAVGYDDQQSIAGSAKEVSGLVADRLKDAGRAVPPIALVGHSMGGLVAREWTEGGGMPGSERIVSLITLGTPHGGSHWASMPPLLGMVSDSEFTIRDLADLILHQPTSPGLRDLAPGSQQLITMNERPRRGDVRYTTVVGIGSPLQREQVEQVSRSLRTLSESQEWLQVLRPRIAPLLGDFDELVQGRGDGVVAASRATFDGVDESVTVDLSHSELIRKLSAQSDHPVWEVVRSRLADRLPTEL